MDLTAAPVVKLESLPAAAPRPSSWHAVKIEKELSSPARLQGQQQQPLLPACSVKPVAVKAMPKKKALAGLSEKEPKTPLPVSVKSEFEAPVAAKVKLEGRGMGRKCTFETRHLSSVSAEPLKGASHPPPSQTPPEQPSSRKQSDNDDCIFVDISPKPAPKARPKSKANASQGDGSQLDAVGTTVSHGSGVQADRMRRTTGSKRSMAKKQGAIRSSIKKSIFKFRRKGHTWPIADPGAPWRRTASGVVLSPGPRASVANQAPQAQVLNELAGKMRDPAKSHKARQSTEHLEVILEVGDLVYTHKTVSSIFQCGRHAGQKILSLASSQGLEHAGAVTFRGGILLSRLPPLVVMSHHRENRVICGNRRLKGMQAIKRWKQQDVFVTCVRHDTKNVPAEVLARYLLASTTQNAGLDASVRS